MRLLFLVSTTFAVANAFFVIPNARTDLNNNGRLLFASVADNNHRRHLSEIDEMCVENAARYCLENALATDCDLEEHEALVSTLHAQRLYHLDHVHKLNGLLIQLPNVNQGPIKHQHLNEQDEKFVEEAAAYLLENTDVPVCDEREIVTLVTTLQEQDQFHMEHLETINSLLARLEGTKVYE
jgi:hypothetical protein